MLTSHSPSSALREPTPLFPTPQREHTATPLFHPKKPPRSPLELVVSPEVATAIAHTATGVTAVSGFFLPSYTNTATNVIRVTSVATYCANADNLGSINPALYIPGAPVRLGSDDPDAARINGAIMSTTGLMTAVFALFLLTGYLKNQNNPGAMQKAHKLLSSLLTLMLSYYGPNVTEVATLSAGHFSAGDKGLSLSSLGLWSAAFLWTSYQVLHKLTKEEESRFSLKPFYDATRHFERLPIRALVLADMAAANLLAMLAGLKPNPESCTVVAGSMLAVSIVYLGYIIGLRPYKSKLDQGLVTINALLQVTLSSLNFATLYDEQLFTTLGQVGLATFCFLYVQMLIIAIKELKNQCTRLCKAPPQTLDPSIMDTVTEALLIMPTSTDLSTSDRYISEDNSGDQHQLDVLSLLLDSKEHTATPLPSDDVRHSMSPDHPPSAHFSLSIFNSPGRLSPVEPEEDALEDLLNRPQDNGRVGLRRDENAPNPLKIFSQ
jgi:hypothetical protein